MKKILLLALLFISILPTYSQTAIGVIGGYNKASQYYSKGSQPYGSLDNLSTSLWRAGLIADHHLWKKLYLQPQLLLNAKGGNSVYSSIPGTIDYTYEEASLRLLYLELQANFIFKQQLGKGNLFLGAGPYIGRGIRGRYAVEGYSVHDGQRIDYEGKKHVAFSGKEGNNFDIYYQKPYDAGFSLQAGYELKNGLFLNVVAGLGLTDLEYGSKIKSTYYGFSVGYFFKKFN